MRLKEFDIDLDAVDADGIALSQAPTSGGTLTLNGPLGTTLDYARQVAVASVGNDTGVTFTITGTDADGYALTDAITGASAGATESTEYFKTITSIANSAATATGGVTVGTVDEALTQTIPLDWRSDTAANINVDVTGTINYTLEQTFDDVQRPGLAPRSAAANSQWLAVATAGAADATLQPTLGATAIRLMVNSYATGGELQMNVVHPTGRRS